MSPDTLNQLVDQAPDKSRASEFARFLRNHIRSFIVPGYDENRIRACNTSGSGIWKLCELAYPDPVKRKSLMASCALTFAASTKAPLDFITSAICESLYITQNPEERQQQYDLLEAKIHELFYPQA
jgi:hypothetical protein